MHLEWQAHYLAIGRQQTQLLWFIGCFTLSLCTSSHLRYHWKIHCLDVFLIESLVDFYCYLSPSTCCELAIKLLDPENSLEFGMPIATGAIRRKVVWFAPDSTLNQGAVLHSYNSSGPVAMLRASTVSGLQEPALWQPSKLVKLFACHVACVLRETMCTSCVRQGIRWFSKTTLTLLRV